MAKKGRSLSSPNMDHFTKTTICASQPTQDLDGRHLLSCDSTAEITWTFPSSAKGP